MRNLTLSDYIVITQVQVIVMFQCVSFRYSVCGKIIINSMPTDVSQVCCYLFCHSSQPLLTVSCTCTNSCRVGSQVLTRAVQAWDEQGKTLVSTTTAGPDGEFCFLLPVGNYIVKVIQPLWLFVRHFIFVVLCRQP